MPRKKVYKDSATRVAEFRKRKKEALKALQALEKIVHTVPQEPEPEVKLEPIVPHVTYQYPCIYCQRICKCGNPSPEGKAVCSECEEKRKGYYDKDGIWRRGSKKELEKMQKQSRANLAYFHRYR